MSSTPPFATIRITQPGHPYQGDTVDVLRIFPALDPDLLVRAPDQLHFRLAMSATDYPGGSPPPDPEGAPAPPPLLDPQGVRQLARLVARLPRPDPAAPPPAVPPDPAPGAPALPPPASLPETP